MGDLQTIESLQDWGDIRHSCNKPAFIVLNRYTGLWRLDATRILALEFLRSAAEENQIILNFRSPLSADRSLLITINYDHFNLK